MDFFLQKKIPKKVIKSLDYYLVIRYNRVINKEDESPRRNTMKVKFQELMPGTILRNKRSGKDFKVIGFLEDEPKVELQNLETKEIIKVLDRTYARWYSVEKLSTKEEIEDLAEKILNGETKAEEKPAAPKVAAKRPSVRKRPVRPSVIKEEIKDDSEKEIVEVKEARKPKKERQPSRKADFVLSMTKKIESLIAESFPSSRREVTASYIKYRHKYAFVKIFQSKSKVRINILTRAMTPEQKARLSRIVSASYRWPLDGFFEIQSEKDLDFAMELIEHSYKGAKQ